MRQCLFIISVLSGLLFPASILSQELISNKSVTGICYAGKRTTKLYVPPPRDFLEKSQGKGGGTIKAYYNGFSAEAVTSFEYAMRILESILPAGTKTSVVANWTKITSANVLGNSSVTAVVGGWSIDAYRPFALYPVALAEKIAGFNLNSDPSGDIVLTLNSSASWYFGTDGKVPAGKYDLVTVILHELCHGLGFFDSMSADNSTGWYGISSLPVIYDTFIENIDGKSLTDTLKFRNNSSELLSEFTSGKLYMRGPVLKAFTDMEKVRVYAPSTWDDGSSISHLDEEMSLDSEGRLMTPFIDMQEAIHNPGIYTRAILGDLGWINTRILHDPPGDTEENLTSLNLEVEIRSDTTFNRDKVGAVLSYDGFKTADTVFMYSADADNNFRYPVNIPSYKTEVQYYFFTEDIFKRIFRSPSPYNFLRYKSYIGTDTTKAIINHSPAAYYFTAASEVNLDVEVTDNLGVDSVCLEYMINDGTKKYSGFTIDSADIYTLTLQAADLNWRGGDFLRYRIIAYDSAAVANMSVSPDTGYYSVDIIGIEDVVNSYSSDFTENAGDFYLSGLVIKKLTGWQKTGIHSQHPYISPEKDSTINAIALLKTPVRFDKSGMLIQYNDIALVEPGETGSLFGSEDFYDYVVLEGSRDFGRTWKSFFDGYDASYNSVWLKAYNSSIVEQNSTAAGKESMLLHHTELVQPGDYFKSGDTVIIRMRLFSDPFANGWGWVVQDLEINPLVDAVENNMAEKISLYPNPGNGTIHLNFREEGYSAYKTARYEIFTITGIPVVSGYMLPESGETIDLSHHPPGFYIIRLNIDGRISTLRYSYMK